MPIRNFFLNFCQYFCWLFLLIDANVFADRLFGGVVFYGDFHREAVEQLPGGANGRVRALRRPAPAREIFERTSEMKHEREARLTGILDELSTLYARMDDANLDRLVDWLRGDGAVFIGGAGRSGLLLRCFAMRLMHMGKRVYLLGDTLTPAAGDGDILLVGSGSGETESLVAAMRKADRLGLRKALLTTRPESTMATLADIVVTLPAPTPKVGGQAGAVTSRQPMGNLFEQGMFLFLDALVMELMETEGMSSDAMFTRHANLE